MKPGDLVIFTCHTSVPFVSVTDLGIFLSSRITKWDSKVKFCTFITPMGLREVVLGKGTMWEVIQ